MTDVRVEESLLEFLTTKFPESEFVSCTTIHQCGVSRLDYVNWDNFDTLCSDALP